MLNRVILPPLLVMLLLTLLVGLTAYQLTDTWRQTSQKTVDMAVQSVVLTNIRWELYQASTLLESQPEAAHRNWNEVKEQINLLSRTHPNTPDLMLLKTFTANDNNIRNIPSILEKPFLNARLNETQDSLEQLQDYSRFVTSAINLSMLLLGGFLIMITAKDLSRLLKELVRSRDMNIRLQEEERRRIAQDLHDGVVQELIDLKRNYQPEKVENIISNLRRVCHNLKPQVLDDLGLAAALEFLADDLRQSGVITVQVNLDQQGLARLPKKYELPLFRVVQELCSNIKNHAQASQATITVVYDPNESFMLSGYVTDNGKGFDPKTTDSQSMGLAGVRERIQQFGGRLNIDSKPGIGSKFQFFIPVTDRVEDTLHV